MYLYLIACAVIWVVMCAILLIVLCMNLSRISQEEEAAELRRRFGKGK